MSKKNSNKENESIIPVKRIKIQYETINILLYKEHLFVVKKEKLFKKSFYFKSKSSISGCYSDTIKVSIPVTKKSFENVINYVNTDTIKITDDTVVEMLKITEFFQIKCLYNKCLDHYVNKLTSTTIGSELLSLNIDKPQTDKKIRT